MTRPMIAIDRGTDLFAIQGLPPDFAGFQDLPHEVLKRCFASQRKAQGFDAADQPALPMADCR